jgi:hypothetical protein
MKFYLEGSPNKMVEGELAGTWNGASIPRFTEEQATKLTKVYPEYFRVYYSQAAASKLDAPAFLIYYYSSQHYDTWSFENGIVEVDGLNWIAVSEDVQNE